VRIVQYHPRLFVAAAAGVVLAAVLPTELRLSARLLMGWDFAVLVYLVQAVIAIRRFDIKRVQLRAEQQDEGGAALLMITVAASVASLAAIVMELGAAHASGIGSQRQAFLLCAVTIVLSWSVIHVLFAFHYAHEFYRGPGDRGSGLIFPEDEWPNYWDFVYFSFVIGMTFQVSDVQVTNKAMRQRVVAHGAIAFLFNVAILALAVNIGAGLL
jgi:uncharacterized membrane protein